MLPLLSLVRNNIGPNNAAHVISFLYVAIMHCKCKFALVCTLCSLSVVPTCIFMDQCLSYWKLGF